MPSNKNILMKIVIKQVSDKVEVIIVETKWETGINAREEDDSKKRLVIYSPLLQTIILLTQIIKSNENKIDDNPITDNSELIASELDTYLDKDLNYNFVTTDSLTIDETNGLVLMREEEILARDVYAVMFDQWSLTIFDRISSSEQRHTTAVLNLLNFYSIPDPATSTIGTFSNATLQQLYTDLIALGNSSVESALTVGCNIEEIDILDLVHLIDSTNNQNIITVYTNLLNGSKNHLRAFVRVLETYGITYQPQYLDTVFYNEIINTSFQGNGNGGNGHGHGHGCNGNS